MGHFYVFWIVEIKPNRAKRLIYAKCLSMKWLEKNDWCAFVNMDNWNKYFSIRYNVQLKTTEESNSVYQFANQADSVDIAHHYNYIEAAWKLMTEWIWNLLSNYSLDVSFHFLVRFPLCLPTFF